METNSVIIATPAPTLDAPCGPSWRATVTAGRLKRMVEAITLSFKHMHAPDGGYWNAWMCVASGKHNVMCVRRVLLDGRALTATVRLDGLAIDGRERAEPSAPANSAAVEVGAAPIQELWAWLGKRGPATAVEMAFSQGRLTFGTVNALVLEAPSGAADALVDAGWHNPAAVPDIAFPFDTRKAAERWLHTVLGFLAHPNAPDKRPYERYLYADPELGGVGATDSNQLLRLPLPEMALEALVGLDEAVLRGFLAWLSPKGQDEWEQEAGLAYMALGDGEGSLQGHVGDAMVMVGGQFRFPNPPNIQGVCPGRPEADGAEEKGALHAVDAAGRRAWAVGGTRNYALDAEALVKALDDAAAAWVQFVAANSAAGVKVSTDKSAAHDTAHPDGRRMANPAKWLPNPMFAEADGRLCAHFYTDMDSLRKDMEQGGTALAALSREVGTALGDAAPAGPLNMVFSHRYVRRMAENAPRLGYGDRPTLSFSDDHRLTLVPSHVGPTAPTDAMVCMGIVILAGGRS